jgi:hypothetical protein
MHIKERLQESVQDLIDRIESGKIQGEELGLPPTDVLARQGFLYGLSLQIQKQITEGPTPRRYWKQKKSSGSYWF